MFTLIFQIILVLLICLFICIYLRQMYESYIICKNIPGPIFLPVIGHLHYTPSHPRQILSHCMELVEKYGKLIQFWAGPKHILFTTDAKIVERLLSSSKHIKKLHSIYRYVKPWLGNGLVMNQGQSWRKRRKMLTPAFHFDILQEALNISNHSVSSVIEKIEKNLDGEAFDINPIEASYSLDTICGAAMGINIKSQFNFLSHYAQTVEKVLNALTQRYLKFISGYFDFIYYRTQDGRDLKQYIQTLQNLGFQIIAERRLLRENNQTSNREHKTFLDILLDCTMDANPLSDLEILDEVNVFLFGGFETLCTASGFLFYELANNPEIQNKLFREIKHELGNDKTITLTMNKLNNLKYLEAVLKETLRFYPPVAFILRQLDEDLEVDGMVIPKGRGISVFVYGIHHDKDYFAEPECFKPERFLDKDITRNSFTFIPFGAGYRSCIGQKYAMLVLKFLVVKILQNFELFTAGPEYKLKLSMAMTLTAENGIFVRAKRRKYD